MLTDPDKRELLKSIEHLSKELVQPNPAGETGPKSWIKKLFVKAERPPEKSVEKREKVICISGANLEWILENHKVKFISVCARCNAVLCCRTTPKLKGDVVTACARILGCRTLSIGDGANDVAMIQGRARNHIFNNIVF